MARHSSESWHVGESWVGPRTTSQSLRAIDRFDTCVNEPTANVCTFGHSEKIIESISAT
jgi:hypothetical protein